MPTNDLYGINECTGGVDLHRRIQCSCCCCCVAAFQWGAVRSRSDPKVEDDAISITNVNRPLIAEQLSNRAEASWIIRLGCFPSNGSGCFLWDVVVVWHVRSGGGWYRWYSDTLTPTAIASYDLRFFWCALNRSPPVGWVALLTRLGSVRFGSVRFGSVRFGSVQLNIRLRLTWPPLVWMGAVLILASDSGWNLGSWRGQIIADW